jgi:NhaA family Na+:H+ antiporter
LLSLAIVDDLGAVLIIAFVFSETLHLGWLAIAAAGFLVVWVFNRIGVRQVGVYFVVGAVIWLAFLESGVHPTVAGVLLGLLTPPSAWLSEQALNQVMRELREKSGSGVDLGEQPDDLDLLRFTARETSSPLHRLEGALHPWVAFVIMPLFALANAGVRLEPAALAEPVAVAVAAGLTIGKPLGILLACVIAVRLGIGVLPEGVSWPLLAAGACLAGICFTMALFLNTLAFADFPEYETAGKIGTLSGSLVSVVLGGVLLLAASRGKAANPQADRGG